MTQAEIDKKLIDTHRLNGEDAAELERQTGYMVTRLAPVRGVPVWTATEAEANDLAAWACHKYPGSLYGVFKLARAYHVELSPPPGPESEASA